MSSSSRKSVVKKASIGHFKWAKPQTTPGGYMDPEEYDIGNKLVQGYELFGRASLWFSLKYGSFSLPSRRLAYQEVCTCS